MPTSYKILGQINPSASTFATLYNVPAAAQTVIATINICNLDSVARAFRLATVKSGANTTTPTTNTFIAYDTAIPANDSLALTIGITLAANDTVVVYANSSANMAFTAYGSEVT